MIDAGIFSTFIFMKRNFVLFGVLSAMASFYGCGGDSKSSAPEEPVVDPVADRCYEKYGFEENAEWSKMISGDSYLEKIVCDRVSERMSYMLSFYARCTKAKYDKSKKRFEINVLTERGDNHLWADVTGCKYKLGVDDNYQFNGFVANSPEFDFGECFCKTEGEKTYYRNINPELLKEESSSSAESSSSDSKISSSSKDEKGSSSSAAKSSSSVVPASSSSAKSSSSQTPVAGEASLTKHGSGSANQEVAQGASIVEFYYTIDGATGATVTGLPQGVTGTLKGLDYYISGTVASTAAAGAYKFTVTTTGATTNVSKSGTITVTGDGNIEPKSSSSETAAVSSSSEKLSSSSEVAESSSSSETAQGIQAVVLTRVNLSVSGNELSIMGAMAKPITVFDMQGRLIYRNFSTSNQHAVTLPGAGGYLVRVGSESHTVRIR